MSLLELCDAAYMVIVGQLERQYLADRTAFLTVALTKGDGEAEPPLWEERQAELDRWLNDEPTVQSDDLLVQLGIAA